MRPDTGFARHQIVTAPECSLHHAAGRPEDHSGAAASAERIVKFFLRKVLHIQMISPDHAGDLSRCQHQIHISSVSAVIDVRDFRLLFLGDARHDRNIKNPVCINPKFSQQYTSSSPPLHLMRRFRR